MSRLVHGEPRRSRRAEAAIARQALRRLRNGALLIGLTFGGVAASSAVTYVGSFPTDAARRSMASSFSGAGGFSVLFGQVDRIGTVGGYTAYKGFVFLTTIGALWAALAVTRQLRGEEDRGRWHLVVAGGTTPGRATVATLLGVLAALAVVLVETAVLAMAASLHPEVSFTIGGSVMFGLSTLLPALVLAGAAAVCSQLAQTRRLATALSMGVVAAAFVLRMIADAGPGSRWVLWATPFGWAELVHPLTSNDPVPVLAAAALTVVLASLAAFLAGRRDVGGGLLATASSRPPRSFGLSSPLSVAARLQAAVLALWALGMATLSFVLGIVAKPVADALADSTSTGDALTRLGAKGSGAIDYLGVVFLLVGAVLALLPASQVGAARDEESTGRLALILANPPGRAAWLGGRLALAGGSVAGTGLLCGASAWVGTRTQGLHVGFDVMLIAGLNIVPAGLLTLGAGALALAAAPRLAAAAVYVIVVWSLMADLIGTMVKGLGGLARLSVFHYTALAPAEDPSAAVMAACTLAALGLSAAAIAIFIRRDLTDG